LNHELFGAPVKGIIPAENTCCVTDLTGPHVRFISYPNPPAPLKKAMPAWGRSWGIDPGLRRPELSGRHSARPAWSAPARTRLSWPSLDHDPPAPLETRLERPEPAGRRPSAQPDWPAPLGRDPPSLRSAATFLPRSTSPSSTASPTRKKRDPPSSAMTLPSLCLVRLQPYPARRGRRGAHQRQAAPPRGGHVARRRVTHG
jgi:hypothetical protein